MGQETIEQSNNTAKMLMEQDEVISSIDSKLDVVDRNNASAAKLVKSMSSTWGQIKNLFTPSKRKEEMKVPEKTTVAKSKGPVLVPYIPEDQFEVVSEDKTVGGVPSSSSAILEGQDS
jgi:hypothetical protein